MIERQAADGVAPLASDQHALQTLRIPWPQARNEGVRRSAGAKPGAHTWKVVRPGGTAHIDSPVVRHGEPTRFVVLRAAEQRGIDDFPARIELQYENIAPRTGELALDRIGGGGEIGRLGLPQDVYRSVPRHFEIARGIPVASSGARSPYDVAGTPVDLHHHRVHGGIRCGRRFGRQVWEVRRVGMAAEVNIAGAVERDAVAVVRARAAQIAHQKGLRRGGSRSQRESPADCKQAFHALTPVSTAFCRVPWFPPPRAAQSPSGCASPNYGTLSITAVKRRFLETGRPIKSHLAVTSPTHRTARPPRPANRLS